MPYTFCYPTLKPPTALPQLDQLHHQIRELSVGALEVPRSFKLPGEVCNTNRYCDGFTMFQQLSFFCCPRVSLV